MPSLADELDDFLPAGLRADIENRYYARVNEQARLERLLPDPEFFQNSATHPALFPDHGVVHVRDVARQVLAVLASVSGVLIPARPAAGRGRCMQSYSVLLAYLHDIGMADVSAFGRKMHAEFAVQAPFAPELDGWVEAVWRANCGGLAGRLGQLAQAGLLACPPQVVLRELLALAGCHRKSAFPVELLNTPGWLRRRLQAIVATDLRALHAAPAAPETLPRSPARLAALQPCYADFESQAFAWLDGEAGALRELRADAIDTVRALRAADALRQRGTVLKTSAGYEILLDWTNGYALYALRLGEDQLYLLSVESPLATGEANLCAVELTPDGDLRFAFERGAFASAATSAYVAASMAVAIDDIRADAAGSFIRPAGEARALGLKAAEGMCLLLESPDDNLDFGDLVAAALRQQCAGLPNPVCTVPSLRQADPVERARYLAAGPLNWDTRQRLALAQRLGRSGQRVDGLDLAAAFEHVRQIRLQAGELLVSAGLEAGFVYLPLGDGLTVVPLGGYPTFTVRPWMWLGVSGVIRGAARNATVVASRPVALLVIPRAVYLKHWHRPYTPADMQARLTPTANA